MTHPGMFTAGAVVVEFGDARTCWPAVHWAAAEAGRRGHELVVARPLNPGLGVVFPEAPVALTTAGDKLAWHLDRVVAGVASAHPGLPVSGIVLEPTHTALSRLSTAVQATLVVVGPNRRNLARTPCPLVVVNGSARRPGAPRPVVVSADEAGRCEPALRFAFGFAQRHATAVRVVHAWSWRTPPAFLRLRRRTAHGRRAVCPVAVVPAHTPEEG
jgi:hypothetical protein